MWCIGEGMWEGVWSFHVLSGHITLPELHIFTHHRGAHQISLYGRLWSLIYKTPYLSLPRVIVGAKNSSSLITLSFWWPAPIQRCYWVPTLRPHTRVNLVVLKGGSLWIDTSIAQTFPKILWTLWLVLGTKNKDFFYYSTVLHLLHISVAISHISCC